jgi:ribose 1,5-bisphosphate isomerase
MDDQAFQQICLDEIGLDRQRGASQLARRCLQMGAEFAHRCTVRDPNALAEALRGFARGLEETRPSMAPIHNLLHQWRTSLQQMPKHSLAAARVHAARSAQGLEQRSRTAVTDIARHAADLITPGQTIITHSLSSTTLEIFRRVAGHGIRAIVTESRPLQEGWTLASRLSQLGIETQYITDAQMGLFAARADVAMVGADSLLGDGSVVNKAGTYLLALATREAKVPFYVSSESFKQAPWSTGAVVLEENDPAELGITPLMHVVPKNVYFDITPSRLVTGIITEKGLQNPGSICPN